MRGEGVNGLYQTLVEAMWQAEGVNAEFLASLAEPWGATVYSTGPEGSTLPMEGTLARIPTGVVAELRRSIRWCEEAIEEERSFYLTDVIGEEWELDLSPSVRAYIQTMEENIAELKRELAEL